MIEDLYPATPMQQGMLFHTLLVQRSGDHIGQLNLLFRGELDLRAFVAAWRRVIARHAALRTGFVGFERKEPLQLVHTEAEVPLTVLDWRGLDGDRRQELLQAYLEEDLRRDFDLARPPLMRLTLIREEEEAYRFLFTHYHAILDGWSQPILVREFQACYRAALRGEDAELAPVAPYRDYIAWLVGQESGAAEAYWRRELAGFTEPTPLGGEAELAADRTSVAPRFIVSRAVLSAEATGGLRAFARAQQVTMNTLVQGAWALLLGRASGRSDVVFGVVSSGRSAPVPGVETMVGLFINTLPSRVRLRGDMGLGDWLRQIQERQAELRQYEHSSLAEVQSWSEVASGVPLFESIVAFENFPIDESVQRETGEALGVAEVSAFDQTIYPLGLTVSPGARLSLTLRSNPLRFGEAALRRMLAQLEGLLVGMLDQGERPLESLPVLTAGERHQLLCEWTDTARGLARESCLPERIASWSEELGEAIAVSNGALQLSYGELASRSRRWGAWLRGLGIGRESVVGLSLGRTPALIETLLGAWEAEGLFVVLDPALPLERRRWMVEDAGVELVLTDTAHWQEWSCPTFTVEEAVLPADPGARWNGTRPLETGAYAIYTSGSTGRPKGVVVAHAGLRDLLENQEELLAVGPGSRVLQWASWSFDAAVADLTMSLGAGGTLVLGGEVPLLGGELTEVLAHEGVSHCTVTPSALSSVPAGDLPALSTLIVAGEAFPAELAEKWTDGRRLMNHYGPTEATVWATAQRISAAGSPPIGRPIANGRAYVVDGAGAPAPPGRSGELWLGGSGIARGYLDRPELTAERFVPDPFGGRGERLYRTGDLVRFRSDGALEFLGRIDSQVKVRGYRIELGEIEAALASHPQVEGAAVAVVQPDGIGDRRLVAFVVPRQRSAGLVEELRQTLDRTLPEYMMPNHFVVLERLPLTAAGKVDRRELERWAPERDRAGRATAAAPQALPRTPVEEIVAGVFAEVLQLDRVGIHDDFFDIGGHSLLGIQVVSRLQQLFGIEPPLGILFDNPTVARLSTCIEDLQTVDRGAVVPPLLPVSRDGDLPLSFAQERLWFMTQLDPGLTTYNLPMKLVLRGDLDAAALRWSLRELVRRHEVLRTRYEYREGRPVQVIDPAGEAALPLVDLQGLSETRRVEEARRLLRQQEARPFDLSRETPLRIVLLRLERDGHALGLTMHHIASDGWSQGLLAREVSTLYAARVRGEAPHLPELGVQYADFAVWQRGWLAGDELERQLSYWRGALQGAPPLLELPLDRQRPAVPSFRGSLIPFRLGADLAAELATLSRSHGATLFMVLLAGLSALLSRLTGQEDLVIGTVVANRNRREIEELIGFFVNTLGLRMKTADNPTVSEMIGLGREAALGSYAHQDLPFEKLVEELAPQRSRAHAPLFQVLFILQNAPEAVLALPGLTPERLSEGLEAAARFDLTLTASERPDGILGTWAYNRDVFDPATIFRLVEMFRTLLGGAVRQPGSHLSELPLLSPAQRHQLMVDWEDTAADRTAPGVLGLIGLHARQRPDAVAAVHGGEHLTYGQLGDRVEGLASRLRDQGVGPEVRVGVCLERSLELLIGFVAVLKAGGVYVPLDPSYPIGRLATLLEDAFAGSALRLALGAEGPVHDALASRLPDLRWLRPDAAEEGLPQPPGAALWEDAAPETLAYLIYTSGSTGVPKGVAVTHGSLANTAAARRRLAAVESDDRALQFFSLSFDPSVSDMVVTLTSGACLCLADPARLMPGPDLAGLLNEAGITMVSMPPSALAALPEEPYPALRTLAVGGEACPPELAWRWAQSRRMINAYGPTEMAICASAGFLQAGETLSIGRPIDHTWACVLDGRMSPVPIGVAGELHLTGLGLARGYHGQPEATAEVFVPDPFSRQAGGRLYRTGDRVRRLPDGRLEFLGRVDRQVKVRGFRIELGEVEAALACHPAVAEAVALVREERTGDRRLVAYAVPRAGAISPAELRAFLRGLLPDYMVPSHFIVLDRLPLLPNGKVDLQALARETGRPKPAAEATAPRNPWEAALAEVFAEVLGLDSVGVEDDFFELGGHSLLAVGLAAKIEKRFGRKLPLAVLFEGPTVEQLASRLFDTARLTAWSPLVALRSQGSRRPFFCVHPLGGAVVGYYRHLVRHLGEDQPVYGLQARGLEEQAGLQHPSIEEMASEYVAALRSVQPHGPYLLGGASYGGTIALEMAQQLAQHGEEIAVLAMIDAKANPLATAEGEAAEEKEEAALPDLAGFAFGMAQSLATLAERELRLTFEELQGLRDEEFLTLLLERLREAGLVDESIDVPWLLRYRASLVTRVEAGARYRARPYHGRIDLFRTVPGAPAEPTEGDDSAWGWDAVALSGVEVHWISGTHQTMLLEPAVIDVAARLTACFERVQGSWVAAAPAPPRSEPGAEEKASPVPGAARRRR